MSIDERCAVCTELFTAPRHLPCGHTFCQTCIDTLSKAKIACPVCRAPFVLPPGGAGALPLSPALAAMAAAARARASQPSEMDENMVCGVCKEIDIAAPAAAFCPTCNEHLCAKHANHHKRKKRTHPIVESIDGCRLSVPTQAGAGCCPTHPAHALRAVCSCGEVICQECVFHAHNGHSFTLFEKLADDFKKTLPGTIAALGRHEAALQGALAAVAGAEATLRTAVAAAEQRIDAMRDRVVARVTARAEALRAGLSEMADRKGKQLDAQREALELGLVRVQGVRELGARALGGGDAFSTVAAAREAEKQAQAVGASEWDLEPATSGAVEVTEDGAGAVEAAVGTMGAVRDRDIVRPPAAAARELTDERIANARVWGKQGTGNGEFKYPSFLSVGPDGSVYIADYSNHRVQVFRSDGTFVRVWGSQGNGNGQFSNPYGIACGPDGSVYVADCNNHRVQVF